MRELLGQSTETAVLQDTHIARTFAHDRRNLVHVEPAENAKQDHFGLISRQARTYERDGGVSSEYVDRGHGWVVFGRVIIQDVRCYRNAASSRFAASPVDQAVPCNSEYPGTELLLVTAKAVEVSSGDEPRVRFDVFRGYRIEPS